jgi:lysophospholipase L1-like esterase
MVAYGYTIDAANKRETGHYRASPRYGVVLDPGAADVNSRGMRDREYPPAPAPGIVRVLLLGDSITEWGRWSELVEERLNAEGLRCEILNAAVAGWNLYQYWAFLKDNVSVYQPDLVLVGFCLNDIPQSNLMATVLPRGEDAYYFVPRAGPGRELDVRFTARISPFWFTHSALYRLAASLVWLRRHEDRGIADDRPGMLREMKEMSRGRILGIVFPYLIPLDRYSGEQRRDYAETVGRLDEAGIEYLDLTPAMNRSGAKIVDLRETALDPVHYSAAANALKAEIICRWLKPRLEALRRARAGSVGH